jgi:regulator of cell morphogenesis and NO signaling
MHNYLSTDKVAELISQDYSLLQVMSRFNIPLGVKEKSIDEVCRANNVDTETFLAVLNFIGNGCNHKYIAEPETLSLPSLMNYLRQAHSYFLDFSFPAIRRKLINAVGNGSDNESALLILQYYDTYVSEVREHFEYENAIVFPYIDSLINQSHTSFNIDTFSAQHDPAAKKLTELKNIIIRYYEAPAGSYALHDVLFDIFGCEEELKAHGLVEEHLLVPAVKLLERESAVHKEKTEKEGDDDEQSSTLSPREKDVIIGVVKGLTNKEIADKLCISLNTVLTHRRNIARKLEIHSPAGLTIYAIINGLVELKDVSL